MTRLAKFIQLIHHDRAEYIPRGRRQRHSALGEVSTVSCVFFGKLGGACQG